MDNFLFSPSKVKKQLVVSVAVIGAIVTLYITVNGRYLTLGSTEVFAIESKQNLRSPAEDSRKWLDESGVVFKYEDSDDIRHRHCHRSLYTPLLEPSNPCDNKTFLYVVIISAPSSSHHRIVYRNTVLSVLNTSEMAQVRYTFLLGKTNDTEITKEISVESKEYGDMLIGNFFDSYDNLTLKSLFMTQWVVRRCHQAHYVCKIDDDVYANLKKITEYLTSNPIPKYSLLGSLFNGTRPIHDKKRKWYVDNFFKPVFPPYLSGTSYVVDTSLLLPIFKAAISVEMVRLEDVFITGLAAAHTNLTLHYTNFPGFTYAKRSANLRSSDLSKILTIHGLTTEQLAAIWKLYLGKNKNSITSRISGK